MSHLIAFSEKRVDPAINTPFFAELLSGNIAGRRSIGIRPRWRTSPGWCGAPLAAAENESDKDLDDIHLQAKLLLWV